MVETKNTFTPHFDEEKDSKGKEMGKSSSIKQQSAGFTQKTGRRKTAVARVRLLNGKGEIIVNEKPLDQYFGDIKHARASILKPLILVGLDNKYDLQVKVHGGGKQSQLDAVVLGVSRGILDKSEDYRLSLRKEGFLTRDSRKKERKKPGLKRARKASQFRKR